MPTPCVCQLPHHQSMCYSHCPHRLAMPGSAKVRGFQWQGCASAAMGRGWLGSGQGELVKSHTGQGQHQVPVQGQWGVAMPVPTDPQGSSTCSHLPDPASCQGRAVAQNLPRFPSRKPSRHCLRLPGAPTAQCPSPSCQQLLGSGPGCPKPCRAKTSEHLPTNL